MALPMRQLARHVTALGTADGMVPQPTPPHVAPPIALPIELFGTVHDTVYGTLYISRIGSGQVKTSKPFLGSRRLTRPDPTPEV